ncbi:C1 family peptidase [Mycoplasmopsis gallinarum]
MKISTEMIKKFYQKYQNNNQNKIIESAITKNGIKNATFNNDMLRKHNFEFSLESKKVGMTNQKNSGRCWIFSALNILKVQVAEKLNIDNFELSQNYLLFWDKMEKANNLFENIIANPNLDFDDRLFQMLVESSLSDGGFWEWAQGLIKKYGIVPKQTMPETFNSENTTVYNDVIMVHIVSTIKKLKKLVLENKMTQAEEFKQLSLDRLFEINAKVFGLPPQNFALEYRDKDKKFHLIENLDPLTFLNKYTDNQFINYVNLLDDPRNKYPKNRLLVSKYFKSVIEEKTLSSINTNIQEIKQAIIKSLENNEPVWFDCDVSKFSDVQTGIMDTNLYLIDQTLRPFNDLSKADRLNYRITSPTHAMTLVGVDLDISGKPIKWEIENSWGDQKGNKGYFSMSDEWFDEYVFAAIVNPKYVNPDVLEALKQEPIFIEPWDILS